MLEKVAEKTGYAPEELDLDAHLETELGIDSIRQIEVILALRDELKLPPDEGFRISQYPTLRALIAYLTQRLGGAATPFEVARPAPAASGEVVTPGVEASAERAETSSEETEPPPGSAEAPRELELLSAPF